MNLFENLNAMEKSTKNVKHESKRIKRESLEDIDAIRMIDYIRDGLDAIDDYLQTNGALPDQAADPLRRMYKDIDIAYEFVSRFKTEATSGINGAYTTKAIDMIPGKTKIKESSETLKNNYLSKIDKTNSNVDLVNMLHKIRDNKGLNKEDIKELEQKIRTKVKTIKNESITRIWDETFDDEDLQKRLDYTKANPQGYNSEEYAETFKFEDKEYFMISDGKFITYDNEDVVCYLVIDENLAKYIAYFNVEFIPFSDGDGENGMSAPDYTINELPFKVDKIDD